MLQILNATPEAYEPPFSHPAPVKTQIRENT
nr:MAG TPA: hypothetical protein [Caudoviricetes sp.]